MANAKVDKATAVYLPPKDGPFLCGRCEYFIPDHGCRKVAGTVEYYGCCNFFEPDPKLQAKS